MIPLFTRSYFFSYFLPVALRPNAGHGLLILDVSRSHTTTQHIRQDSCGRVISSSQRPLPDNTQHSQQTNIYVPGGIRTHDLSRRAAADPRLRPRGYWDRLTGSYTVAKVVKVLAKMRTGLCIVRYVTHNTTIMHYIFKKYIRNKIFASQMKSYIF